MNHSKLPSGSYFTCPSFPRWGCHCRRPLTLGPRVTQVHVSPLKSVVTGLWVEERRAGQPAGGGVGMGVGACPGVWPTCIPETRSLKVRHTREKATFSFHQVPKKVNDRVMPLCLCFVSWSGRCHKNFLFAVWTLANYKVGAIIFFHIKFIFRHDFKEQETCSFSTSLTIHHSPFSPVVFREDGYHSFHWPQNGLVNDHRVLLIVPILTEKLKLHM